jgi:plasmid stabilization system protein ParE
MEDRRCQIVWTKRSQLPLRAAYRYISQDSIPNAAKVMDGIIAAVEKAMANPGFYGPDKYKADNDGSYRAFEKHSYRIVYRCTQKPSGY